MLAYVILHDESFLMHPRDPIWQHYELFEWWLLPHGIAGACAPLLGPMQFSDRLRTRFRRLHRVVGRIYVAGVFVAAPLGSHIQYFEERMGDPRSFSVAAAVDAALRTLTTGIALIFILKRKVQEHRQWMTRSFAVAIVFLEVRVIGGGPAPEAPLGGPATVACSPEEEFQTDRWQPGSTRISTRA
jgi:hypothetical protein